MVSLKNGWGENIYSTEMMEIIDRLTAVYQGDLHIGMDLGSQDALCLLRLFVGDAFAVDQGDKGGVFTGKGTSHRAQAVTGSFSIYSSLPLQRPRISP